MKESFYNTIIKCVELFDNNTYPIVLINNFNGGGQVFLAQAIFIVL